MDYLPAPRHAPLDLRAVLRRALQDRAIRVQPDRKEGVENHGYITTHSNTSKGRPTFHHAAKPEQAYAAQFQVRRAGMDITYRGRRM